MTKQIVFLTEQEMTESVEKITGGTDVVLTFSEALETDIIQFSLPLQDPATNAFIATIAEPNDVMQNEDMISVPVASFIPAISNLIQIPLKENFDICECNLYDGETLYTFFVA